MTEEWGGTMARASVVGGRISLTTLRASRLGRWCARRDVLAGLVLLALALDLRVYWSPKLLQIPDALAYAFWGQTIVHHFLDFYSYGGMSPDWWLVPAYLPVANYLYGIVDLIFVALAHLFGQVTVTHDLLVSPWLRLVVKMPAILADLVVTTVIYVEARRRMRLPWAWIVAALFAFSPYMFLDVEIWGQTDGILTMMVVVTMLLMLRRQSVWAGLALALIVNFKPQPVVFVPLVLIYLLRWDGWRAALRSAAAFAATTLVVWLPYLLPPRFEIVAWQANLARIQVAEGDRVARGAQNFWTLIGLPDVSAAHRLFGLVPVGLTGDVVFAAVLVIPLVTTWRDRSAGRLWASAAFIALASYYFLPLQFPRYLIPAVVLLLLAALFDQRYWLPFALVYVTTTIGQTQEFFGCHCLVNNYWEALAPVQAVVSSVDPRLVAAGNGLALVAAAGIYLWTKAPPAPVASTDEGGPRATEILPGSGADTMRRARQSSSTPAVAGSAHATPRGASGRVLRPRRLSRPPYISVVIPCYNEEGNIQAMYDRLTAVLGSLTPIYEIIFVNNGSYDGSADLLDDLAARDARVSVLTLSRNFGSQGAYSAGFAYASGDCVVGLDGDIQDPPELIADFVARWRDGYDVVYGVRARRKGSLPRRIGYKLFYRVLRRISYVEIPLDASDFALMDRRVLNVLNAMPERSRLIRGLRAYAGFSQTGISYVRQERFAGKTTNSFLGLFRWAGLGIVSFSFAPLDLISYLAISVVGITGLALVIYTALYFIVPGAPRGFQTLLVITLFLGSVQLLCLSIIGTYLGKIFEEVKARPNFLVHDVQNDHRSGVAATTTRPPHLLPDSVPETPEDLPSQPRARSAGDLPRTHVPS
jgi:dolichol-phosphate mannosyltransferase